MDTKLKKYNRAKRTGIIITGLAAALFVALFPIFRHKAVQYREMAGREQLEEEAFLQALIRSNYVFYKNVMDKGGSKIYSYEDLYMDKTIEELDENTADENSADIYPESDDDIWEGEVVEVLDNKLKQTADIRQLNSIAALYAGQLQDEIDIIYEYVDAIGARMDYYVLDKATGASMKNTSLPIEELLRLKGYANVESGNNMQDNTNAESGSTSDIEAAYEYYIIMDYDSFGNLQNISVKGQNGAGLLQTVRSVEGSPRGRILSDRYETETFMLYDEKEGRWTKQLTLTQKKPVNAAFIYAITSEQMQFFINTKYESGYGYAYGESFSYLGVSFGARPVIYSYYQAGADSIYLLFLTAIFAITVLLAVFKPLALEGRKERKAPIEAVAIAAVLLLVLSYDGVVELIANVESTDAMPYGELWFIELIALLLPDKAECAYIAQIVSKIIKYGVSFCVFALIFGIWYFLCLEVSDVARDVKKYFGTRCLIYIRLKRARAYIGQCIHNFKAEIKSADLGKDMNKLIKKLIVINFCLLLAISLLWGFGIPFLIVYSFGLYYIIKKYIGKVSAQYQNLLEAVGAIAHGNLNNSFEKEFGVFESSKEELYEIQNGFKNAVDKEVKSQMMKTELITNVSHDLKTPLTAIITYIDLMKEENITEEQRKVYLDTLERKSLRLKVLIEDLFEVSRASSGNISLDLIPVDICNLMRQVYLEHEDKMKQIGLQIRFALPEEKIILQLDSQKTYRIFENLYGNVIKYALPDTRVFVTAYERGQVDGAGSIDKGEGGTGSGIGGSARGGTGSGIHIEIKNISAQEIIGDPQYLSERFVRGDASRNTEGSGLGLAIARSFTELQGGTFRIETDGDLFKVILEWG